MGELLFITLVYLWTMLALGTPHTYLPPGWPEPDVKGVPAFWSNLVVVYQSRVTLLASSPCALLFADFIRYFLSVIFVGS